MNVSKSDNASQKDRSKLRNFDLTVEEIRILKAIKDLTLSLENIERKDNRPERLEYFRCAIRQLEDKLEEVRENTLIR
jgi:predicted ferric reductase